MRLVAFCCFFLIFLCRNRSVAFVPVAQSFSHNEIELGKDLVVFFHLSLAYFSLKYGPFHMNT